MKNVAWNLFEILINIYQGIVAMYFYLSISAANILINL